jgi:hypothetical protein
MCTYIHALIIAAALTLFPSFAAATTIYLDPATGSYGPGDTFVTSVRLETDGECLNAVHTDIVYPKESLKAVDFGRGDSILTLWIGDPRIDNEAGIVSFEGGVPGGYCGRIQGDPALSNVLGKVVFTVISADAKKATILPGSASRIYLNDGLGTAVRPQFTSAAITLLPNSTGAPNPWIEEVEQDSIPPDTFTVQVESTRGVFGGKYYAVFSTVDKQSGMDHFEIFERGGWKTISSPYALWDQTLRSGVQIKAVDKAGNERLGEYIEGSAPPRQYSIGDILLPLIAIAILLLAGLVKFLLYWRDKKSAGEVTDKEVIDLRP